MRDYILVPILTLTSSDSRKGDSLVSPAVEHITEQIITRQEVENLQKIRKSTSYGQLSGRRSDATSHTGAFGQLGSHDNAFSSKDYFSRFDTSLAEIKDNLDRLEKTLW